ncbi:branched-chain amino acid ABC transporter substrate-binding protein [Denitratisoma oestradiolicum]|uniref:Branched chain amino acid ABC transporter substrate-binding protein n=1 Tax=Denitratisoma oestradiolicum TaxID=311182 RepID=A0A6S6YIB2_9PROT|nr:branched-chain amino acid ABC transporter substrate-binding protein [Denitratisoma oestradiolicum]TWO79730.1 branched chain amino acid ABC transporter substrate-binding protein [Denitratisoma oestradiolicum]CAB1367494.1 Branched chain amino acid ABC transporter substrate-binding protein [Denitratisoma oestradiolicum]
MTTVFRFLPLALALAFSLASCGRQDSAAGDTVKIGMAAPLTGSQSDIGLDIQRGTQLGIDDLNAQGLEINGRKLKFELLSEDDEANPAKATTVAQKLVDAKVVAVVGHFNSGASIPASKIYADAGIPQVSPGSTAPRYTQQGYATTFRVVANDDQQGPAAASFLVHSLKAKKVAIIDDSTAYGQGLASTFEAAVKAAGVEVVAHEHTTDKDTDFAAILTKIKGKQPEYLFFGGIYSQGAPMAKQMKALGLDVPLIGGDGIQTPKFIEVAGAAAEGSYASIPGLPKDQMPGGKAFLEKFQARYNKQVELFAPMGYDAVFVLAEAMKRAGSTEPAKVLPELKKTRYNGVIGPIEFDDKGDLKNGPITINVVKNGKWETRDVVMPGGAK